MNPDNELGNQELFTICIKNQFLLLCFKTAYLGGVKMAEEQDGVITFSSTNSLKEQQNGEQSLQNNF